MGADLKYYSQYRASAIALIFANAVPLIGALFVGIDTFAIVALYWVENVIIGLINVLKMIVCSPDLEEIDWSKFGSPARIRAIKVALKQTDFDSTAAYAHHGLKLFLVPFFIVHYALFCAVHGFFVFAIFGRDGFEPSPARLARSFGDLVSDKLALLGRARARGEPSLLIRRELYWPRRVPTDACSFVDDAAVCPRHRTTRGHHLRWLHRDGVRQPAGSARSSHRREDGARPHLPSARATAERARRRN